MQLVLPVWRRRPLSPPQRRPLVLRGHLLHQAADVVRRLVRLAAVDGRPEGPLAPAERGGLAEGAHQLGASLLGERDAGRVGALAPPAGTY